MDGRWRTPAFAMMWVLAVVAMLGIHIIHERAPEGLARSAVGVSVRTPRDEPAPPVLDVTPASRPEFGAPRPHRHDHRHTGRSPYRGPTSGRILWTFPIGGPIGGRAIVGEDGVLFVGSHDHHLYAVSRDGRMLWRADLGGPIPSTPAWIAGRVLAGADPNRVVCLDASEGRVLWRLDAGADATTGMAMAPDGTLIFGAGSEVFAVTAEGEVRWRFRTEDQVWSTPAVDDEGTVYVGSQDDHVYAIASDGRMRWRYRTGGDVDASPAIGDDGTIYVGSDDRRVYALRRDGTLRWSTEVEGEVRAPIGLGHDGTLYVVVVAPRARVVALDSASGGQRWAFEISPSPSGARVAGGPLVDRDGFLYFGGADGFVYSLTPDGHLRWFVKTGGRVESEPVLTPEGMLVVGSDDHRLYAIGEP
jgi:outer membrane protein assembly factor BamB